MQESLLDYINSLTLIILWNLEKQLYSLNKCLYHCISSCFWLL